jgi:hypothetical protein
MSSTGQPLRYRTIVADPPWHYEAFATAPSRAEMRHNDPLPYGSMSEEEILALAPLVRSLIAPRGMAESASQQVRRWPEEPLGEHGAHLYWYRLLSRAGIVARGTTAGSRMHDARHTAGQRVLEATGNLKAAQMLLGHADIGTTAKHYTGWDHDQLDGSMRTTLGLPSLAAELYEQAVKGAREVRQ